MPDLQPFPHCAMLVGNTGGRHMHENGDDPYALNRFIDAQSECYDTVIAELSAGQKQTHWMWFVFPQIDGLGFSPTARFYAIKSPAEAEAYLDHALLSPRLMECTRLLLSHPGLSASAIFGSPDDMKLCSSMTLFDHVSEEKAVFSQILEMFYAGNRDCRTLDILLDMPNLNT